MWEIRSIDLGARAAFVATLRFYIRALVMKKVSAVDVRFGPIADIGLTRPMAQDARPKSKMRYPPTVECR